MQNLIKVSEIITTSHIIDCDADPMVGANSEIKNHIKCGQLKLDFTKIILYLSKEQQTSVVDGDEVIGELEDKHALNACVLDYLLVRSQLIPEEWKGKMVLFWGTIYHETSYNRLYVRYLCYDGDGWYSDTAWIDNGFGYDDPAAVFIHR